MAFTKIKQPTKRGRPKGSLNKRSQIPDELHKEALEKLSIAVNSGESWAIQSVLDRTMPKIKPVSTGAEKLLIEAQIELTVLKAKEISEFEQRLIELEQAAK